MNKHDPRVDAYIAKSAEFARPILEQLRAAVHATCPEVEEGIKWSMPFFSYQGAPMCHMAAFKQHCSFGLWGAEVAATMKQDGALGTEDVARWVKIAGVKDLPKDKAMLGYIRQAMTFVDGGGKTFPKRDKAKTKPEAKVPAELAAALKKNKAAAKVFAEFSPGCRREYVEWIAEGKQRNWRYQAC